MAAPKNAPRMLAMYSPGGTSAPKSIRASTVPVMMPTRAISPISSAAPKEFVPFAHSVTLATIRRASRPSASFPSTIGHD